MTLTDAGPLVALLNRNDPDHEACVAAASLLSSPLLTTWPAFTEAIYLLGDEGGWTAQEKLWLLVRRGDLQITPTESAHLRRVEELMRKYADVPMDLADATLVALAEQKRLRRIFTLDSDFRVYRIQGRRAFETVP